MQGIETLYADACIQAVLAARHALMHMPIEQALGKTRYGKGDTYGLDGGPEIAIKNVIHRLKDDALFVTEETDPQFGSHWSDGTQFPVTFFCDPTDRSKFLRLFIERANASGRNSRKVGELLYECDREAEWGKIFPEGKIELPLSIVSPSTAITCVRHGRPLFSAIVSYLTDQIFIAGPTGAFMLKLPDYRNTKAVQEVNFTFITNHGQLLHFLSAQEMCLTDDECLRYATFLGKAGYQENFDATAMFVGRTPKDFLHHTEPGGPSRALYLSELQRGHGPMGFVMSNGEKIGEFVHWLTFVMNGKLADGQKALTMYEVSIERPWTKEGILMSTSPPYSIFRERTDRGDYYLDVRRLRKFTHPSHFRSTLVVTQADNSTLRGIMGQHCYREITFD